MKIAIWCRHENDSVIGYNGDLPWHVSSDLARFKKITQGHNIVCGRRTYETFPNRTLPERNICVLTNNHEYQVSDDVHHTVVTDIASLSEIEGDLYIVGGATVYSLFMEKLPPEIIVDSVYHGELPAKNGKLTDIKEVVSYMEKHYKKLISLPEVDNVSVTIWLKKGEFVEQKTLRHILESCS